MAKRRRRNSNFGTILSILILAALLGFIGYMLWEDPSLIAALDMTANPTASAQPMTDPAAEPTATPTAAPALEPTATIEPTALPTAEPTAIPTAEPTAEPTAVPTPEPVVVSNGLEIDTSALSADVLPDRDGIEVRSKIYANGEQVETYTRADAITMASSDEYAVLEGITTFRGSNYRDRASWGTVPNDAHDFDIEYTIRIGGIDEWTGVGWTGQPAIVRWSEETRLNMNIKDEKKNKEGLVEVIYATLDGKIYFFDLEDGKATRNPINIGAPIKGSVTIDPRGLPLLYVGQGIDTVDGESVKIGMRIFSLIDQKELLFINGRDKFATRGWYASDCAPLVDASSDTVIWSGENGLLYTIKLNTNYDAEAGTISIDPVIDRYWYESKVSTRPGMENSVAVYNHYAYFADNSGLITCLDLNTMTPVWAFDAGDDTDASIVLEERDGSVYLYTGSELDLTADKNGKGTIYLRCLNALTGEEMWNKPVKATESSDSGGMFATPALGTGSVDHLTFFAVARAIKDNGERMNSLYAIDKVSGETVWHISTGGYCWSSPTLIFDDNGRAYLIQNNSNGDMKLIDALTGEKITSIDLKHNVEGSPVIFDDMLVVGTRGGRIYGVRIK